MILWPWFSQADNSTPLAAQECYKIIGLYDSV